MIPDDQFAQMIQRMTRLKANAAAVTARGEFRDQAEREEMLLAVANGLCDMEAALLETATALRQGMQATRKGFAQVMADAEG